MGAVKVLIRGVVVGGMLLSRSSENVFAGGGGLEAETSKVYVAITDAAGKLKAGDKSACNVVLDNVDQMYAQTKRAAQETADAQQRADAAEKALTALKVEYDTVQKEADAARHELETAQQNLVEVKEQLKAEQARTELLKKEVEALKLQLKQKEGAPRSEAGNVPVADKIPAGKTELLDVKLLEKAIEDIESGKLDDKELLKLKSELGIAQADQPRRDEREKSPVRHNLKQTSSSKPTSPRWPRKTLKLTSSETRYST